MTVPAALGYSVQVRKGMRGWVWTIRLGGKHPYGREQAKGVADTPSQALQDAAAAMRETPA